MQLSLSHIWPIFAVAFAVWAFKRYRWQRLLKRNGIPGPEPNLFFGHVFDLQQRNLQVVNKWIKEYGRIVGTFNIGPNVIIADTELIGKIQIKDFSLFPHRRTLVKEGGFDANPEYEVSITSTDLAAQRWKEQRSLISTAFTLSKIKASVPLVNDGIDVLLENIDRMSADEEDFNIYDLFQRLTMDTIGRSAFGVHLDVQRNPDNKFFVATKTAFENLSKSWSSILTFVTFLFPEFFYPLYPVRRLLRRLLHLIGRPTHLTYQLEMCKKIIQERKNSVTDATRDKHSQDDFLQRMIEATLTTEQMDGLTESTLALTADMKGEHETLLLSKKSKSSSKLHRMTDQEVAANASIIFDAGFETTSTFLGFLFHVLVNRKDIQDEIRMEVMQLIEKDGELNYNTVHSLPYLDSVVYETLRYYPPVTGFVSRQSSVDYKYKDITIPANVGLEIAVHFLHFDPEIWEDPQTFDPSRFDRANKSRTSHPGFQAFGAGPRNCLGMRFALMEGKLTTARILQRYKLIPGPRTETFDGIEIEYKPVTQNPKKGVFVKAVKID